MRDLLLTLVVTGLLPFILAQPYIGALAWAWIGMMNPHKMTWGFAFDFPFAQVIAATTLVALPFAKEKGRIPWAAPTVFIVLFYLWTGCTALTGFGDPEAVFSSWLQLTKAILMLLVTMMLIQDRKKIEMLIWVIVISIGYFGFKGGLFTLVRGGGERVWGPPGGMVEGNNEIGLALIIVIPLMYFLMQSLKDSPLVRVGVPWVRRGLLAGMAFSGIAVLGTHSRGAFLGILGMAVLLALKGKNKLLSLICIALGLGLALSFMPEHWWARMGTILTREDGSAQGRLQAWVMHWNLAMDRPILGGGFDFLTNAAMLYRYDPTELGHRAAHSIYFQALGEHGFIGLTLYVMIGLTGWRIATRLIKECRGNREFEWVVQLMRMIQVSLFGFAIGGAFLSLVNWDVPYYLVAIVVLVESVVRRARSVTQPGKLGVAGKPWRDGLAVQGSGARGFVQRAPRKREGPAA